MIHFPDRISNLAFGRTNSVNLTEMYEILFFNKFFPRFVIGKKLYRFRAHIPKL